MAKGIFVTFEGGEGSGKTTLLEKLQKHLLSQGISVLRTREPGGCALAEQVRHLLLHYQHKYPLSDRAELFLFLAARAQHLQEVICPALDQGRVVLCDRFNDSTVAYQGAARGLGMDYVEKCCRLATHEKEPDVTFLLDIDPVLGMSRVKERISHIQATEQSSQLDRLENEALAFHYKVRDAYLVLAKKYPNRIIVLDASLSQDEVYKQALCHLDTILANLR